MVSVRASVCVRTGVSARRQGGLLNVGGAEKEGNSGMGGESILCVEVRNRAEREGGRRKKEKEEKGKYKRQNKGGERKRRESEKGKKI